jgi:hypothetical protein
VEATEHPTARQVALERFERATELPLLILALAMIRCSSRRSSST